jgi:hypothetical protein
MPNIIVGLSIASVAGIFVLYQEMFVTSFVGSTEIELTFQKSLRKNSE